MKNSEIKKQLSNCKKQIVSTIKMVEKLDTETRDLFELEDILSLLLSLEDMLGNILSIRTSKK